MVHNKLCEVLPVLVDFLVALHVGDSGPEDGVGAIMRVLEAVRVLRRAVPAKRSQKPLPSTLGSLGRRQRERERDDKFKRSFGMIQFVFLGSRFASLATASSATATCAY